MAWEPETLAAGEANSVTVTATSAGAEIKSDGVFIDFDGFRYVRRPNDETGELDTVPEDVYQEEFRFADPLVLGEGECQVIKGQIELPAELYSSGEVEEEGYRYRIRGRLEAFGNDPDSGYLEVAVAGQEPPPLVAVEEAVEEES